MISKKISLFLLCIISITAIFAGELKYLTKHERVSFNLKKNKGILRYYRLKAGEKLDFIAKDAGDIIIYSRVNVSARTEKYHYIIRHSGWEKKIVKTAGISKNVLVTSVKKISAYNKYRLKAKKGRAKYSILNDNRFDIFIKIKITNETKVKSHAGFITISPTEYLETVTIKGKDKEWTYYSPANGRITFYPEGPMQIKIISRYIFAKAKHDKPNYSYRIFDNGKEVAEILGSTNPSRKGLLIDNSSVSRGLVHYKKISSGKHNLTIQTSDENLIFRIFIEKNAIRKS